MGGTPHPADARSNLTRRRRVRRRDAALDRRESRRDEHMHAAASTTTTNSARCFSGKNRTTTQRQTTTQKKGLGSLASTTKMRCGTLARARAGVQETFETLLKENKRAFIPFICAGDPNLDATKKALKILDDAGADIVELGVPYSDPLADGPVIQASATRALANGATLNKVIDLVREVSPTMRAPIVMFTYYNPIYQRGVDKFCEEIASAGAKGLLVPDIPLEETYEMSETAAKYGLDLVLLSTPTTPVERAKKIAQATKGFVYLVSVTGVTGVQTNVATRVEQLVEELRSVTDKPIAVGFGVSEAKQAKQIVDWGADGVIVGSALVRALGEAKTPEEGLAALKAKAEELRSGASP